MTRSPSFPPMLTHQTERSMNDYSHFHELVRVDIQELLKSQPSTEELTPVKAVLDGLTLVNPISQSEGNQSAVHGAPSDPSPDESEAPLTSSEEEEDAESVTTIDESSPSLCMKPLSPVSAGSDGEECLELVVLRRKTYPPSGDWPEYKKVARLPGDIIYGLKVWMVDGVVHYSKRHKHEMVLNDEEWDGVFLRLSRDFWKMLLRAVNDDEAWDSFGYWTPPLRAGEDPFDWDLYWFLVHRGKDSLWFILMGLQQAPEGRFYLHFLTEFDEEFEEGEERTWLD